MISVADSRGRLENVAAVKRANNRSFQKGSLEIVLSGNDSCDFATDTYLSLEIIVNESLKVNCTLIVLDHKTRKSAKFILVKVGNILQVFLSGP